MSAYIIVTLVAYLLGSISFSVIISKKMAGFDVREKGSGNAGATNMLRSVGKKGAIFTLIGDCLKGVVAILFAIGIAKIYKKLQRTENIYILSAHCNFCLFIFLFWQVISLFVFYNDSVNRKEMNFHEKQIPQLY